MVDLLKSLTEKLGNLAGKWTAYAAFGSFLLYLIGYLTLRFQLSTYGLATDLDLFDEKYLFAGCRFLVYLVSSVPNILIVLLLLAAIGYFPWRLASSLRQDVSRWFGGWCAKPIHLPVLGIVLAVVFIQFVMRKCFAFGNLLLRKQLPDEWITSVLLSSDGMLTLYFSGLLAGTLIAGFIAWQSVERGSATSAAGRFFTALLVFLVAVEFLLLPVNYGVLISTQQLPQVADLPGDAKALDGQRAWLVWNSKDNLTYFIYGSQDRRMLLTVPRKDAPVRIVAYDDIYCVLFSADHSGSRPCPR